MNLLNLEVKIERIKLQVEPNATLAFSLRLGRVLTSITHKIGDVLAPGPFMDIRESLILTCEQSHLKSVSRGCLVINKVGNRNQKQLLGMVFIPLSNAERQISYYRIQQSSCTDPYVELSFSIQNLQLDNKMNESTQQKSSLAEIKQLHRYLSIGVGVDVDIEQKNEFRFYEENERNEFELRGENKDMDRMDDSKILGQDLCNVNEYRKQLKVLQKDLGRQRQRIEILTKLYMIEGEKNKQLKGMLDGVLDGLRRERQKKGDVFVQEIDSVLICDQDKEDVEGKVEYRVLLQERDQYYGLCEELEEKVRLLGEEKKGLVRKLQEVENQLSIRIGQISELKIQNSDLRAEMFDLYDESSPMDMQLKQQNERLKQGIQEFERKMKECMKVIQGYKENVWKMQEQLLLKENEIVGLREENQLGRCGSFGLRKSTRDSTQNSCQKRDQMSVENLRGFWGVLLNSRQERMEIFQRLKELREEKGFESDGIECRIIKIIKDRIEDLFMGLKNKGIGMISLLEIRRNVMRVVNLSV